MRRQDDTQQLLDYLRREAEEIAALRAELKAKCMVYQYEAKCRVAQHYGLAFSAVDLPYPQWVELREKYQRETGHRP